MEAFKSSLIIFALLASLTQAASFPDISKHISSIDLRSQSDILTAPTWADSMTPNAYVSRRDATCIPSAQISSAISSLPMFPTAVQFLNLRGMTPYSLLLFCSSSSQSYYLFLYATSLGLVRLNVYSDRGYSKVTSASILDTDLFINQQFQKQF